MHKSYSRKTILGLGMIVFLASMPLASNQASVPPSRYRYFLQASSRAEVRRLAGWLNRSDFDVAGVNLQNGTVEVITSEKGVRDLQSVGLHGRLVNIPVAGGKSTRLTGLDSRYLDPDKVAARLGDLHSKFPNVTRILEIGRSLNGRPILAMVISTTPDLADPKFHEKPTILFDGMHHAREIMTPEIVLDIGSTLLGAANPGTRAAMMLENTNIVLIPMLNVDGNARVWNDDHMWRKNAHAEGSSVFGVDINRNYPYRWAGCGGSSNRKGAQDYHGAGAASEPETKALMNLASRVHPMASLSYHSYSELVLYPYGCDGDLTGENALLSTLGRSMAEMLPSDSGRGHYTPGTPWQIVYSVDGDSMGYLFATYGAVTFTFEVNQEFQPSYDLRAPTLQKHRVAWQYFLDQIQKHLATVAVRDVQGRPVQAEISIGQIPHSKGERDFSTNVGGNYFKVLLPGNYTVLAKTKSGLTGSVELNMGDHPESITLVVQ